MLGKQGGYVRNKPKGEPGIVLGWGVDRATVRLLLAVGALHVNEGTGPK